MKNREKLLEIASRKMDALTTITQGLSIVEEHNEEETLGLLGTKKSSFKKMRRRGSGNFRMKAFKSRKSSSMGDLFKKPSSMTDLIGDLPLTSALPPPPPPPPLPPKRKGTRRRHSLSAELEAVSHSTRRTSTRRAPTSRRSSTRSMSPHSLRSRWSSEASQPINRNSQRSFESAPPEVSTMAVEDAVESLQAERKDSPYMQFTKRRGSMGKMEDLNMSLFTTSRKDIFSSTSRKDIFSFDEDGCKEVDIIHRLNTKPGPEVVELPKIAMPNSPTSVAAMFQPEFTQQPETPTSHSGSRLPKAISSKVAEILHDSNHSSDMAPFHDDYHRRSCPNLYASRRSIVSFCEEKNQSIDSPWNKNSDHRKTCWYSSDDYNHNIRIAKIRKKVKKKLVKNLPVKKGYFEQQEDSNEEDPIEGLEVLGKPVKRKNLRLTKKGKKIIEQLLDVIMEKPYDEILSFIQSPVSVSFCKKKKRLRVEKYL